MTGLNSPQISVVIPAYNAAGLLPAALESVFNQTVRPHEVIVVDDGSRDATAEVAGRFPAVTVIRQENGGPGAARNRGIHAATGEWIALLDADDTWLPERLERQLPYTQDPAVALIQGRGDTRAARAAPDCIDFERLWQGNCITTTTVLLRRSAVMEAGLFSEDRALIGVEDYHLWLRLAAADWKLVTCPEMLHRYTPAPGSLSGQVERFVQAELANVAAVGACLAIEDPRLRRKRAAILEEYGQDLLHDRVLPAARELLHRALCEAPSARRLAWCLAARLPWATLDRVRRRSPAR